VEATLTRVSGRHDGAALSAVVDLHDVERVGQHGLDVLEGRCSKNIARRTSTSSG
jgi:hypothetical protein